MTYKTTLSFNTLYYESTKLARHTLEIVQIVNQTNSIHIHGHDKSLVFQYLKYFLGTFFNFTICS